LADLHRDRSRAESCGSQAELYHRLRPDPPAALIDELAALAPRRVLDIGCGTGKVAGALAARGLDVLGVEIDARMAALAPVPVEVAAFEDWDEAGRTFDLITCGDAWHWIDPERGWRKIGHVLAPGGTVARFWNHEEPEEPLRSALRDVYRRVAPELEDRIHSRDEDDPRTDTRTYEWTRTYSAGEWVALVSTYSAHRALGPARLVALQRELRAVIDAAGGTVTSRGTTYVSRSRAARR
jgi:SAM-dependent methyltransferase